MKEDFLVETFKSKDEIVKRHAAMFYGKQGPSVIVNVWHEHLPKSNLSKFTNAAVDVVIKQSKPELAKVITNPKLRHPANSTSREQIDGFNSSVILNTLTENDMSQANLGWIDQREKILADDDRRYAYIQHEPKVQLLADDDGTILFDLPPRINTGS
ncbi:hypothetical protein B0O80DRAFT_134146 [Mortierella sp. GBAus27b]|nr:hypothetical protein B0O80DRAFT_134146 [Mortierella sp. GBAus27b]